ncbi:hypothetical protein STEG23_018804, partial [Scotinomys teguina]
MALTEGLGAASSRLTVSVPGHLISADRNFLRNLDLGYKSVTQSDQFEVFTEDTITGVFGHSKKSMKRRVVSEYTMPFFLFSSTMNITDVGM